MEEVEHRSPDQDLFARVDSPEKHVEGYVSYCVLTQVSCIFALLKQGA